MQTLGGNMELLNDQRHSLINAFILVEVKISTVMEL